MDGRTDGRLEIPPCVLQDIGPLGPLPKKLKNAKKLKWLLTDRRTDGPTKLGVVA